MSRISAVFAVLLLAVLTATGVYFFSKQHAKYDKHEVQLSAMDKDLAKLESDIADEKNKIDAINREKDNADQAMAEFKARKDRPQIAFLADVIDCNDATGEITLSVGGAVGVKTGLIFTVYRVAVRICDIRIDRVEDAKSFASVVPDSIVDPEIRIQVGDTARNYVSEQ